MNLSLGVTQLRPVTPGQDVVVDQPVVVASSRAPGTMRLKSTQMGSTAVVLPQGRCTRAPSGPPSSARVPWSTISGRIAKIQDRIEYSLENLNHILPELEARCGLPMITISWGWDNMACGVRKSTSAFPSNEDFRLGAVVRSLRHGHGHAVWLPLDV